MTQRIWVSLAFALAAGASFPAHAQDCDSLVVDGAQVLGADAARVKQAATELENRGATVRVRTVRDFGGFPNLDQYEANVESGCRSWQAPEGGTKNNLIVFMISFGEKRGAGLYYGSLWQRTLDAQWNGILTEEVVPRLRDQDYGNGIAAGLREIGTAIAAPRPVPGATAPTTTTVIREKPTDFTGLWKVLGWLLGLAAATGLAFGIVALLKQRARRRAAQQKAKATKSVCSSYVLELDEPMKLLEARVNKISQDVSAEDAEPLRTKYATAKREMENATARFGELTTTVMNPDRDNLSCEEYDQITTAYGQVLAMLRSVREAMTAIDASVSELFKAVSTVPAKVAEHGSEVDAAAQQVANVAAEGYKADDQQNAITVAQADVKVAKSLLAERRYGAAKKKAADAEANAQKAAAEATALPKRKTAIEAAVAALRDRMPTTDASLDAGRQTFEAIASTYAESCWENVRGNGTEAENRLEWAAKATEEAEADADMQAQRWKHGEDLVVQANAWLDEAESLMRSLAALKTNLEAAKRDAAGEVEAALKDIGAARTFIAAHDDDVRDELEVGLDEAEQAVKNARTELGREKPDYLVAVKLAIGANAAADKILDQARSEHDAAERKRQKAATLMREAERSVSAAKEYVEDHSSDTDRDTDSMLREATRLLGLAKAAGTIDELITYAEQADKKADKALEEAKDDVQRARRRRAAASASSSSNWGTRSSSSTSAFGSLGSIGSLGGSSRSSGSRSGGSVGFGGGSRSGGSVSFGGGGRRGGGSVGW